MRDDRILIETRVSAAAIAIVLLAAGITLYGWPLDTTGSSPGRSGRR